MEAAEIKAAFKNLALHSDRLTESQQRLISGFRKHFKRNGELSDRQSKILAEIEGLTCGNAG